MPQNIKKSIANLFAKFKADPVLGLLAALFFFLPFERIPSTDILGITLRLNVLVGVSLIILAGIKIYRRKNPRLGPLSVPLSFLGLFGLWNIMLIPSSINHARAVTVVVYMGFTALIALSIAVLLKNEYLRIITSSLFFGAAIAVIVGIYQYFGNIAGLNGNITGLRDRYSWQLFGFPRIQSTTLEPLFFASYLLLPISLLASHILFKKIRLHRFWAVLLLGCITSLFLTVSRGGYLGFIVMCLWLLTVFILRRSTSIKRVGVLASIIAFSFLLAFGLISKVNKPANLSAKGETGAASYTRQIKDTGLDGGGDERAKARELAITMIKQHPITGVGPGNYGPVSSNNVKGGGWAVANNETLELLAETGIVGFVLFFGFVASLGFLGVVTMLRAPPYEGMLTAGVIGYLLAEAVQYQTFSTLYIIEIWAAVGLLMALINTHHNAKKTI